MHFLTPYLSSDIDLEKLIGNLITRLENFFFLSDDEVLTIRAAHEAVLARLEKCIAGVQNKYYSKDNKPYFSYLHSGQYLAYVYFFSNYFSRSGQIELKDKFYYLNKILHAVDIYSDVELPEVFFLEHPLGTVLGRAKYGNNFFAMQGCTIGGNKGKYPVLGDNLKMFSNSKILGNSTIGNNVVLGANCYIKDTDIPENSLVFGESPNLIIKNV